MLGKYGMSKQLGISRVMLSSMELVMDTMLKGSVALKRGNLLYKYYVNNVFSATVQLGSKSLGN
jgi:hypothetical protein